MTTLLSEVVHKLRTLKEYQFLFFELGSQDADSKELLGDSSKLIDALIKKIEAQELATSKAKRKHG